MLGINDLKTKKDVKTWFGQLVNEKKVNFHPDDDFNDFSSILTKSEIDNYNKMMEKSFEICGDDIYSLALEVAETWFSKLI